MNSNYTRGGGTDFRNLPTNIGLIRRQLMAEIVDIDRKYGTPISAQPHHTVSNWVLVLACLPPNDESDGVTLEEIHENLDNLEYNIRFESVKNVMGPMVSHNPRKIEEMSKINRRILSRVGGIQSIRINEDGKSVNSYTLGIGIRKLEELVAANDFVTYSFNLNYKTQVTLVGGM